MIMPSLMTSILQEHTVQHGAWGWELQLADVKRKVLVADVFDNERSKDFKFLVGLSYNNVNPWNMIELT